MESHLQSKATSAPNTANTHKPQHLARTDKQKGTTFAKPCIGRQTVSIPTIGNGRKNH